MLGVAVAVAGPETKTPLTLVQPLGGGAPIDVPPMEVGVPVMATYCSVPGNKSCNCRLLSVCPSATSTSIR